MTEARSQVELWKDARRSVASAKSRRDVPALVALLDTPRALIGADGRLLPDVREYALRALRKVGDSRAVPRLIELLQDPNVYVRSVAAEALGRIGDRAAIPALLDVLGDPDDYVSRVRGWPGWRAALRRGLDESVFPGEGMAVRQWAFDSLARLRAPEVLVPLVRLLQHENRRIREHTAKQLGDLGDPRALEPLRLAMRRAPFWRKREFRRARRCIEERAM